MSNVFSCICNVSQDATVKYLASGQAVLNVSVANNVGFGDNQKTVWIRVALWGKRAEGTLAEYLKKGQAVFISGEMTTNEYTKQDGTKGFQVEVNANILDLVGGKRSENATAAHESYQADPYPPAAYAPQPAPQYQPPPPQGHLTPHEQYQRDVAAHNARMAAEAPTPPDDDIPF
jgi:single-strand DNA-binding protein